MATEVTVDQLDLRITALEESFEARLQTLEGTVASLVPPTTVPSIVLTPPSSPSPSAAPPVDETPPPPPPPPPPPLAPVVESPRKPSAPPRSQDLIRLPASRPQAAALKPVRSFEVGVEALLRWVGIALVVLAAGFLVSTAIDRGWITKEMQLLGAAVIGAAMLANAVRLHAAGSTPALAERYQLTTRQWISAFAHGGAVVSIVSAGAAYGWLGLGTAATGLGLVTVAAAVSVLVAMRIRLEPVAITSTVAMFIVPTWASIIVDAPVFATGIWLGGFALAALAIGWDRRWQIYRLVSTVAAATWTLGLAIALAIDNNTDHRNAGLALVSVVTAALWMGPALSARQGAYAPTPGPGRSLLASFDHRMVMAIPLWCLSAVDLFAGVETQVVGGRLALALAAGFFLLALAFKYLLAPYLAGKQSSATVGDTLFASHLFGASIVLLVGVVLLLEGSALMVALAAQAVATLVVGSRLNDRWLEANAWLLAGVAGLMAATVLGDRISDGTRSAIAFDLGPLLVIVGLGVFAALIGRIGKKVVAELTYGVVWLLGLTFASSLMAQFSDNEESWLVFGLAATLVTIMASYWLGRWVFTTGVLLGGLVVLGSALSMIDIVDRSTGPSSNLPWAAIWPDLLANLTVVLALVAVAAALWSAAGPATSGRLKAGKARLQATGVLFELSRAMFVLAWVWSLAWLAVVMLQLPTPQDQVAISIVWAIAAAGAIMAAIFTADSVMRTVGLATLALVLGKLLAVDLAEVDTLWRVGLFLVIGLGLLRLGYVLPRLAERYGPEPMPAEPQGPAGVPSPAR